MRKQIGSEGHVYDKSGNLEGLYLIDGAKAREQYGTKRFWQGIDEIVRLYREINPSEFEYTVVENKNIKDTNKNQYGGTKSGSYRQALNLPYGLYLALIDYEATLFRNKKTREAFMKRFPVLRACETV